MSLPTAQLSELYAPIRSELGAVERIFDGEVRSEFPFINEWCNTVRGYRGKMLRPALLLLCARASGRVSPEHATLAAVVEMVHVATLVHDDVLDEADERRRKPTIRALSGNVAAVLLGDYLISHAYHLCSSLQDQHASRRIGATTNIVCEGELLQNFHRGNMQLSESDYFKIIRRKTGALTSVACELGAYFAGAEAEVVESLGEYGMLAGTAFQIVDDTLDVVGDRTEVGKTLGQDAALGKLTLPTIHALRSAGTARAQGIVTALRGGSAENARNLRSDLESLGSFEYSLSTAREHVGRALGRLDCLPPSEARSSLVALAEFIVARRH